MSRIFDRTERPKMSTCPCCGQSIRPVSPVSDILMDGDHGLVFYKSKAVYLTPTQWELFYLLHDAAPRIVSKAYLLDQLYFRSDIDPSSGNINVFLHQLRKRLQDIPEIEIISHFKRGLNLQLTPVLEGVA